MLNIPVSSFRSKEVDLLRYVQKADSFDIEKLPEEGEIYRLLMQDDSIKAENILLGYRKKIDLLYQFQQGKKIYQYKFSDDVVGK